MERPEANLVFEVYEDSTNYVGISQVTLPNIAFLTQSMNGAGLSGNVDAVMLGNVDAMELSLNFQSTTDAAAKLHEPRTHQIELRAAEQHWDTVAGTRKVAHDKYVLKVIPKTLTSGNVATSTTPDASGTYSVVYYAAYRDGKQLWEIDPFNYIYKANGVDYMAEVRKAIGK